MTTTFASPQAELFAPDDALPEGLAFVPDFITRAEEAALLAWCAAQPLHEATYHQYTARRRVHVVEPAQMPPLLQALREQLAAFAGLAPGDFVHAMVGEYRPGTPLGWHRDAPMYGLIAGVSLGGLARLRFRPWPPEAGTRADIVALDLAPRSAYVMRGPARWGWQHSVPPVPALRYSITMRTARS